MLVLEPKHVRCSKVLVIFLNTGGAGTVVRFFLLCDDVCSAGINTLGYAHTP